MHIDEHQEPEDCIRLSASNSVMITKAGLEYENFEVGTKYLLYGVQAETEDNYDWSCAIMDRTECHETDDHLIYYGTAFVLYQRGLWIPTLTGIALLFGIGNVFDSLVSLLAYGFLLRKEKIRILDIE